MDRDTILPSCPNPPLEPPQAGQPVSQHPRAPWLGTTPRPAGTERGAAPASPMGTVPSPGVTYSPGGAAGVAGSCSASAQRQSCSCPRGSAARGHGAAQAERSARTSPMGPGGSARGQGLFRQQWLRCRSPRRSRDRGMAAAGGWERGSASLRRRDASSPRASGCSQALWPRLGEDSHRGFAPIGRWEAQAGRAGQAAASPAWHRAAGGAPGFTCTARVVPSTHKNVSAFPLWLMDDLQTHPTRKQLNGLRANLGQGEDGKASHCAGYAGVGASPVPHWEPYPGGPGRTPQLDQGHRGGGKAGSHHAMSIQMDERIHTVQCHGLQEQPGAARNGTPLFGLVASAHPAPRGPGSPRQRHCCVRRSRAEPRAGQGLYTLQQPRKLSSSTVVLFFKFTLTTRSRLPPTAGMPDRSDRRGHRGEDRGKGRFGDHSYPGALKEPGRGGGTSTRAASATGTAVAGWTSPSFSAGPGQSPSDPGGFVPPYGRGERAPNSFLRAGGRGDALRR